MQRYIGVTGFTAREQVRNALSSVPPGETYKLMVGVLASAKSLRGMPLKPSWQSRYPGAHELKNIFVEDPRVLNLVHFAPGEEYAACMIYDLEQIAEMVGPKLLHGFQLNATWPRWQTLGVYREDRGRWNHVFVLQLGHKALAEMGNDPDAIAKRLAEYGATIDAVLVDCSGGKGVPLDIEASRVLLSAIATRCPNLGLGVAGGLGPGTLDLLGDLPDQFLHLSIDAEGALRTRDGDLNEEAVARYLREAFSRV